MSTASLLRYGLARVIPSLTGGTLSRAIPRNALLIQHPVKRPVNGLATAAATTKSGKAASTPKTKAKAKTTKPKAKAKPAVKKAVAKKPKAKKVAKLKPWEARGADGKLIPLPSATKPKKSSPFILFVQQRSRNLRSDPAVLTKNKDGQDKLDVTKMSKLLATEWYSLGDAGKKPFQEEAEAEKVAYEAAMTAWRSSLSAEDIRRQNAYISRQKKLGKKIHMGRLRDPAKPKAPPSPFFYFLSDFRKTTNISSASEVAVKAGQEWKAMPADQKQSYEKKSQAGQERYRKELEEWRAQA